MSAAVTELNDADFDTTIRLADRPVLVEFWAPWCAPCRMLSPVVRDLAEEFGPRVEIRLLNVDQNPEARTRLAVLSMPTVVMFKNGDEVDRLVGYRAGIKDILRQRLQAML